MGNFRHPNFYISFPNFHSRLSLMRTVWRAPQCPRRTRKTTGEMKYGVPASFPEARQPMRMSMKRIKDGVLPRILLYIQQQENWRQRSRSGILPGGPEEMRTRKKMADGVLSSIPEARQPMRTRIRRIEDGVTPGMLLCIPVARELEPAESFSPPQQSPTK